MCLCTPTISMCGKVVASLYSSSARSALIPNLLFLRPVAIYGWVLGSMSGLIRRATRALVCISPATRSMARSSSDDSTLNIKMFDVESSDRSEEHTSELQSLAYLVCRLLLEKKKNTYILIFNCA